MAVTRTLLPLTGAQRALHDAVGRFAPVPVGEVVGLFTLAAPVTDAALAAAIDRLVARHAALRWRLVETAAGPRLTEHSAVGPRLRSVRLSAGDRVAVDGVVGAEVRQRGDTTRAPMARFVSISGGETRLLAVRLDHRCADFPTLDLIARFLEAELGGTIPAPPVADDAAVQAARAAAEEAHARSASGAADRAFWARHLGGVRGPTDVSGLADGAERGVAASGWRRGEGALYRADPGVPAGRLRAAARTMGMTPCAFVFGLLARFVATRRGQTAAGAPVAGPVVLGATFDRRVGRAARGAFGYHMAALPVVVHGADDADPAAALRAAGQALHAVSAHARLAPSAVQATAGVDWHGPPFRLLFNYVRFERRFGLPAPQGWRALTGLYRPAAALPAGCLQAVMLTVEESADRVETLWQIDHDAMAPGSALALAAAFAAFVRDAVSERPGAAVGSSAAGQAPLATPSATARPDGMTETVEI
ncbi:hypothetical protein EV659_11241 [Rhodothalassium salexigens DSM 2132]|uniref:Condensation domain-containing protein n=1 Tax=Rhodothalassium salexigens DSM 2132 TaxID=1188247 RepID=A0A4R2P877_RHOSA|nr:hypothetical protein [Rhodothalassium salexigens]MBB4212567.1 hypothetical protein [Rhodothalassium salexigens DSM 2132]MBK1640094.1 hypothetical protein [Rhodothalassium salexigens DSM 2132]TCP31112.1 hypothetical protein EV659_11241 [Rhodothalassium salexigens DSM 2132]